MNIHVVPVLQRRFNKPLQKNTRNTNIFIEKCSIKKPNNVIYVAASNTKKHLT